MGAGRQSTGERCHSQQPPCSPRCLQRSPGARRTLAGATARGIRALALHLPLRQLRETLRGPPPRAFTQRHLTPPAQSGLGPDDPALRACSPARNPLGLGRTAAGPWKLPWVRRECVQAMAQGTSCSLLCHPGTWAEMGSRWGWEREPVCDPPFLSWEPPLSLQ